MSELGAIYHELFQLNKVAKAMLTSYRTEEESDAIAQEWAYLTSPRKLRELVSTVIHHLPVPDPPPSDLGSDRV
jgi:hypothetical protein